MPSDSALRWNPGDIAIIDPFFNIKKSNNRVGADRREVIGECQGLSAAAQRNR